MACRTEDVRSFYRGYRLAVTGFNLFLSLQELDVPRVEGPHGLPHEHNRKFIQFGRSALLGLWSASRLKELLELRQALKTLPKPIRQDLSAFLSKLQEYRQHYNRIKRSNANLLNELFGREDDGYYWYWASLKNLDSPQLAELQKSIPAGIGYSELSKLLDQKVREVSDANRSDPHACFVEHTSTILTLPSENLEKSDRGIYATKYLISFWRRRDLEGTSELAGYVIGRILETLRAMSTP